jgi:lipid A disaccharide synthetase
MLNDRTVKMRVFGVCGERSGDAILKRVFREAKRKNLIKVIGGVWTPDSFHEVVSPIFDGPKELGVMGFGLDMMTSIPNAYQRLRQTEQIIRAMCPDLLVTVDAKGFTLRLQSRLVKSPLSGLKTMHICPPSIWAYKTDLTKAINKMPKVNFICPVLPFESFYWKERENVKFVGYFAIEALLDVVENEAPLEENISQSVRSDSSQTKTHSNWTGGVPFPHEIVASLAPRPFLPRVSISQRQKHRDRLKAEYKGKVLDEGDPILLLAPGSRRSVVRSALPVMEKVVNYLQGQGKAFSVLILCPKDADISSDISEICNASFSSFSKVPTQVISEDFKTEAILSSTAALSTSGTIVTELLMFELPPVIIYNAGGKLTEMLAKRLARVEYASICNLMAGNMIIPEFLFEKSKDTQCVAIATYNLLFDEGARNDLIDDTRGLLAQMVLWENDRPVRPSSVVSQLISSIVKSEW